MSYKLNKTDGELLIELADGQLDVTTTDITLIGRNYKGFGEAFNENLVKMLENFASTGAPSNPLIGQLWYDTSDQRLKLYDGTTFRTSGGPIVSSSRPNMVAGDIWIDNLNNKMYFFDGTDLVLVGPDYDSGQGQTGFEVASVIDISARERVILKIWVGGTLFGIIAKEEFRLSGDNKVPGYPDDPDDSFFPPRQLVLKGFNFVDRSFWYQGTAANARALVDAQGNAKTSANFLPSDANGATTGSISIKNSAGLSVGIGDTEYAALKIVGTTTTLETQQSGTNISLRTRIGNQFTNPVFINSSNGRIGMYNTAPQYTLDLTGDFRTTGNAIIDGDLTVNGNATYLDIATLQVEDKNIELSLSNGSAAGNDSIADGGGLTLKSSDGDKNITWLTSNDAWNFNQDVNLDLDYEFKINNQLVLSRTELGPTVTTANGLSSIGTLTELNVDNVNINGSAITVSTGLTVDATGDVTFSNSRIKDVLDPVDDQDVATKLYVDTQLSLEPVALTLDITGLNTPSEGNPYTDVLAILESISPASRKANNVEARIHCTSYVSSNLAGFDVQGAANKSYISVISDDSSAVSVVQDINFDTVSGTASFTPDRLTMIFRVSGGSWTWISTS